MLISSSSVFYVCVSMLAWVGWRFLEAAFYGQLPFLSPTILIKYGNPTTELPNGWAFYFMEMWSVPQTGTE